MTLLLALLFGPPPPQIGMEGNVKNLLVFNRYLTDQEVQEVFCEMIDATHCVCKE